MALRWLREIDGVVGFSISENQSPVQHHCCTLHRSAPLRDCGPRQSPHRRHRQLGSPGSPAHQPDAVHHDRRSAVGHPGARLSVDADRLMCRVCGSQASMLACHHPASTDRPDHRCRRPRERRGSLRFSLVPNPLADDVCLSAITLPGFQGSRLPPGETTLATFTDAVIDALDQIDGPKVLLGHGIGGSIALDVAAHHPHVASGLVLLSPVSVKLNKRWFPSSWPEARSVRWRNGPSAAHRRRCRRASALPGRTPALRSAVPGRVRQR